MEENKVETSAVEEKDTAKEEKKKKLLFVIEIKNLF